MRKIVVDPRGTIRFEKNVIVSRLFDEAQKRGFGLNQLAGIDGLVPPDAFSQADWEDFYQMIGYSVAGYHELSNVSDESAAEASREAQKVLPGSGGCRDKGCPLHSGVEREVKP